MVAADLGRFVVVGLLGAAIVAGAIDIWALYVCSFLLGVGETLHVNSAQAILPALVDPGDLMQANARLASAQVASVQFVGPPLGVVLYNVATSLPFLVDAVSFAGSAALVHALPDEHRVEPPTTRLRDDVAEGMRFMWRDPALRCITMTVAFVNFFSFGGVVARHWGIRAPFVLAGIATLAVALGARRVLRPLTAALDDVTAVAD